ncbi:erythromycin esterase family protein [Halosimplex amylolyticum]|uniref:erythromycin esterase family protein n=1 Tax=Halosimplex amylolyticum TaxID=3396616 RepID=UPI003F57F753
MSPRNRAPQRTEGLDAAVEAVERTARPLEEGLDRIVETAGDASYVLIGEASHGTSEFYRRRAELTAELIRETDVAFVGVEGDWTTCFAVNRHVRCDPDTPEDTQTVLEGFDRWPTWMWANWEVLEFLGWLREYNAERPPEDRVGFYGLDVYSLYESMAAVVDYLDDLDPELADRARDAYHCFEPYGEDAREYARSTRIAPEDCEDEVVSVLTDLVDELPRPETGVDAVDESAFDAVQNAFVAKNAERYYRELAKGGSASWNVRDRHMTDTLDRLCDRDDTEGVAVVWAHNTHVGDARATDMADRGEVNVGQLARERHGDDVHLVGMGTHRGSVIAGRSWGATPERMEVPAATNASYGDVFHRAGVGDAALVFDDADASGLEPERGHRAIGVVYHPERELGNYVPTVLPERYDSFLHVEESRALHPLATRSDPREAPDTYPWGV